MTWICSIARFYRAPRILRVRFLFSGIALSGGFFGVGGSVGSLLAFALNDQIVRAFARTACRGGSPPMIRYCYDAQLLVGFVMEITEQQHVVLRRHLYPRAVPVVVPELSSGGDGGENCGITGDQIPRYGDVEVRPRHARFYRALRG
jgi:hypothetical protein